MIERFIDFISASLWLSEQDIASKGLPKIPPIRFYKRGYLHKSGMRIYFGNPKSTKAHVVASGETMQFFRDCGKLDSETLRWINENDATFSRIDLAVTEWNTFEGLLELGDVEKWYSKGLISSPLVMGGCKEIVDVLPSGKQAETLYIGDMEKRGKRGIFRAYDKGIDLGIGVNMATRIELELRGNNANMTAQRLMETNDIAGNFRSRFNVKSKDFEKMMDADAVDISRGKAKPRQEENEAALKRWDWLIRQVAPALKDAIELEREMGRGDVQLIRFLDASGLLDEMKAGIVANANKLHDNYLASIGIHNGKFSDKELD